MRRMILLLSTLLLCAGLVACSSAPEEAGSPLREYSGNYETTASISYRDLAAQAVISQGTPSSCSVTFTSPPTLTDLSFVFRQDSLDISYLGIGYTLEPDTLPGNAIASLTVAAINAAMQDTGVSVSYEGSVLLLTGTLETGDFVLRLDRESGNLLKLSIPSEDLEIEFLNFRFLD